MIRLLYFIAGSFHGYALYMLFPLGTDYAALFLLIPCLSLITGYFSGRRDEREAAEQTIGQLVDEIIQWEHGNESL